MTEDSLPDHPFTWRHAKRSRISRARLRAALRERRVVRLLLGVYIRADVELTVEVRARAASLVISPHAVVCDRTAAWIWGVECHEFRELDGLPPLETYVLRGHNPPERAEISGGSRDLMPCDWVDLHGVKVTTPLRTALDLGCKLRRREALAAMDSLMRAHVFTHADLRGVLPRYFRRRGVIQLRELVPLVDGRAESPGESWTRLEIIDHGLLAPEPQWWVVIEGVPTYRLDLAYPHARIAVEYDGEEFHSSEEAKERDQARRRWLRENGWTVIVVDKRSFTDEALTAWLGELSAHLRAARQVRPRPFARTAR